MGMTLFESASEGKDEDLSYFLLQLYLLQKTLKLETDFVV